MTSKGFVEEKGKEPVVDRHVRRKLNFDGSSDGELSTSAGSAASGKIYARSIMSTQDL